MYYRLCGECVLRGREDRDFCTALQCKINLEAHACVAFIGADQIDTCAICGKATPTRQMVVCPEDNISICPSCAEKLGTCYTCANAAECNFESNPSTLPKIVQRTIQQGNMKTVATIRNPEREKITCQNGCSCYSEEFGCMREFNWCKNMDYVWSDKSNESQ